MDLIGLIFQGLFQHISKRWPSAVWPLDWSQLSGLFQPECSDPLVKGRCREMPYINHWLSRKWGCDHCDRTLWSQRLQCLIPMQVHRVFLELRLSKACVRPSWFPLSRYLGVTTITFLSIAHNLNVSQLWNIWFTTASFTYKWRWTIPCYNLLTYVCFLGPGMSTWSTSCAMSSTLKRVCWIHQSPGCRMPLLLQDSNCDPISKSVRERPRIQECIIQYHPSSICISDLSRFGKSLDVVDHQQVLQVWQFQ